MIRDTSKSGFAAILVAAYCAAWIGVVTAGLVWLFGASWAVALTVAGGLAVAGVVSMMFLAHEYRQAIDLSEPGVEVAGAARRAMRRPRRMVAERGRSGEDHLPGAAGLLRSRRCRGIPMLARSGMANPVRRRPGRDPRVLAAGLS
jgi:hypothetical protein